MTSSGKLGAFLLAATLAAPAAARAQCTLPQPAESPHVAGVAFETLVERARAAEDAGRVAEAVHGYRAAVDANPFWEEGWWRAALLLSAAGCPDTARLAARHVVTLSPQAGPGWALLGLCDFRLGSYDTAFSYLSRGVGLGLASAPEIGRQGLHALTLLLVRRGEFPRTARNLEILARIEPDDPELVLACGLVALRIPRLPSELEAESRELAAAAGRAGYLLLTGRDAEGHRAWEDLVARHPRARGVNYAYGRILSREGSPRALALLRQEVAAFPDDGEAQLELAFEILERGEAKQALGPARAAVSRLPGSFWSHLALGRALLGAGELDEALVELEQARSLAPDARDVYVVLAQAYARAGRADEVERARARLQSLDAAQQPGR